MPVFRRESPPELPCPTLGRWLPQPFGGLGFRRSRTRSSSLAGAACASWPGLERGPRAPWR